LKSENVFGKRTKPMIEVSRRRVISVFGMATISLALPRLSRAAALPPVAAYRNPGCDCCGKWTESMKKAGFSITLEDDPALDERRAKLGVPANLAGCHTAVMGEYIIEGHVSPEDILGFLDAKLAARGLAVVGMPAGSTGMEMGGNADKYDVMLFMDDGTSRVYASH
jgi:hypothetical protein